MKDCAAFRDRSFWHPNWELSPDEWSAQAWLEPLQSTFGLPIETVSYVDETDNVENSFELLTIEVPLPILPNVALVWRAFDETHERDLLLRETGQPDARLGWIDTHGHPFCLHPEEATFLGSAAAKSSDWEHSSVPLLLLDQFVAITTEEQADQWATARGAALWRLGLASTADVERIGREECSDVERQLGNYRAVFQQGDDVFRIYVQAGLTWDWNDKDDWQLQAHKSFNAIGHLREFDWPCPCHSIRSRDRFKYFPEASAEVAEHNECDEEHPVFPFAQFKRFMNAARQMT